MPGLIGVSEFLEETREDYNSPTTSTFVSRMVQCRQTIAALEETLDFDREGLTKLKKSSQSNTQFGKHPRGQRDVSGARAGTPRLGGPVQGGAGHWGRLSEILRRHQRAQRAHEDADAKHQQHRHVPGGLAAQERTARDEGRDEEALRQGCQRLRLQVHEDREGEEGAGQGRRHDADRGHAGRNRRGD
uniref:Arf-GAP with SH3 domain, ANK repeat and PH domain-containing protein 2 n=1 Tax=Culex pipiens TaxID=7175 RepID=A0A8D8BMF4_CULPI